MTNLKHIGIYVKDIDRQMHFYKKCFNMHVICEKTEDTGELYQQLFGTNSRVLISKLVTEYGADTHQGEMIELIKVIEGPDSREVIRKVQDIGLSHFSIGVDDIEETVKRIKELSGKKITDIIRIGPKLCCFCEDPEGNIIELIQ